MRTTAVQTMDFILWVCDAKLQLGERKLQSPINKSLKWRGRLLGRAEKNVSSDAVASYLTPSVVCRIVSCKTLFAANLFFACLLSMFDKAASANPKRTRDIPLFTTPLRAMKPSPVSRAHLGRFDGSFSARIASSGSWRF